MRARLHPFFETPRWDQILCPTGGSGSDFYEIENPVSSFAPSEDGDAPAILRIRSSLKNYNNEIDLFLDWVSHFVTPLPAGATVGWRASTDNDSMSDIQWNGQALECVNWQECDAVPALDPFPLLTPDEPTLALPAPI